MKIIIAEIETDISKANSGVIEDDNQYFLIDCYLGEDGTLLLCWWNWLDSRFYVELYDRPGFVPDIAPFNGTADQMAF